VGFQPATPAGGPLGVPAFPKPAAL
jgi:hypothetical protein